MDSGYGKIPSPVIKSEKGYWKFYSLPIPSVNSDIRYSDLILFDDFKISDFITDVAPWNNKINFCHLDPDVRETALKIRPEGWKRNFGQVKAAQSHLENHGITKGDVFLFFGWFKRAEYVNGKFRYIYDKEYPNGFHAIYSYLQIDEIYKPNTGKVPRWLSYHPHIKYKETTDFNNANNTVYVAAELFNYPRHFNKNGSVSFVFSDDLILTRKGQPNRTTWELPGFLHPGNGVKLSYNTPHRWSTDGEKAILRSASKGQEFVFTDVGGTVENWCIELIKMHQVTD